MAFEIFDEVTADCLEEGDVIYINTHQDGYWAHMQISNIEDEIISIIVTGQDCNIDEEYEITYEPEDTLSLYMEVDDD